MYLNNQFHLSNLNVYPLKKMKIELALLKQKILMVMWDFHKNPKTKYSIHLITCILMISTGIFPTRLKFVVIKPLYKKGEMINISNYRPISLLTSC